MQRKRSPIFILIILCLVTGVARADKVDDYVRGVMQKQHIPGVSIAVIKDGKIIKVAGYGLANIELNVSASPETVYKIGSVSKQLIAAGVLLLVQEGKINLDDPVSKFLEGTPDTWKPITIKHLLTHTSGLVREAPGFDSRKIQADSDVIKTAYTLPLRFATGEKWEYCNVGYFILAETIRKVTNKPWSEYLNEQVYKPLEMNATRTTDMTALVPNRANGYDWRSGKYENADIYLALRPSGAFLSTVLDLAKWDAVLYTDKILKQPIREMMWTQVKLNNGSTHPYGFGWQVENMNGHRVVLHGGALPGFRSVIARFLDEKLTVVVLTNGDDADSRVIGNRIANFYIPNLIAERIVAKIDEKILDAYTGQYQLNQNVVITVTRNAEKLTFKQSNSEDTLQLTPESETAFFDKENERFSFKFVRDEKDQSLYIVIFSNGQEVARVKKTK